MKAYLFIIFYFLIVISAEAQQRKPVYGVVRDSITLFPIPGAIITNGTTQKMMETDDKGVFRLEAGINDFIYAIAENYSRDTLTYSYIFTDTINILLAPSGNILPNVVVRGNLTKYQMDSIDRKKRFEQINGKVMPTFANNHPSGFGLTVNLDRVFKKKYQERAQNERSYNRMERKAYVDYRFSPHLVNYYTSLKADNLRQFLARYTPSYEWLRKNPSNEDVMYYINEKLKDYRAAGRR